MRIKRNIYTEVCATLGKSELPHAFAPVELSSLQHLRENNSFRRTFSYTPAPTITTRPAMSESALIIDDHPLYRDALAQLLRTILSQTCVEAASSAGEGLRVAEGLPGLRLVLLDFSLPGMSGTEAITTILRKFPAVVVIAVSASEQRRDATAALRAGAKQFISKAVSTEVMADAIRRVLAGDR